MPPGSPPGMPGAGGMPGMKSDFRMQPGMPVWFPNHDPEMLEFMRKEADLDNQSASLAEKFRRASEGDRGDIQKKLEKVVSEQFDLRQERRQKELKKFEEQIKKLRETIEKRQKAKTEIIDRRVKELLGQDEDMRF
jgi:hypothetical protein